MTIKLCIVCDVTSSNACCRSAMVSIRK